MAAPKKYSDELRERATRMALDAIAAEGQRMRSIRRIADQLDILSCPEFCSVGGYLAPVDARAALEQ